MPDRVSKAPDGLWGALKSPQILEAILESASQCILAVGRDGKILAANSRVEPMFGYAPDELQGQAVEVLVPEKLRKAHQKHREGYFQAPRARPMGAGVDLVARRKDGSEFPVEISLSYPANGATPLAIAFISDITRRKSLESQLTQSQKMEAVGRLAGGIAHDFNNLLTVIAGYDRFLLDRLTTLDPLRVYAEEIMKAAERAAALTKQLLAFSRRQVVAPRVLEVNQAIRELEPMVQRLMGENIELLYKLTPHAGRVRIGPSQFDQVLLNLLINARDALPRGGRITVETRRVQLDEDYAKTHVGVNPGSFVMLAVSDNGMGMDRALQEHIFEPFFTTKGAEGGTGLGLATVYGIAKQYGGDVWVYSEVGVGTTFKVYFPRNLRKGDSGEVGVSTSEKRVGSETVLVVEDDPGVRQLITALLRENGYTVLTASSPREALELSSQKSATIHLLLTDVVLPGISGQELANQLKRECTSLKVLFMSGYPENAMADHGVLDPGANFVQKPFTFDELLVKVRGALDG